MNGMHNTNISVAAVAEVIHANRKDQRYASHLIQFIDGILRDVANTSFRCSGYDDDDDEDDVVGTGTNNCSIKYGSVISGSILYVILMCVRRRLDQMRGLNQCGLQTLGMEHVGMEMSARSSSCWNLIVLQVIVPYILLRYPKVRIGNRQGQIISSLDHSLNGRSANHLSHIRRNFAGSSSLEGLRGDARRSVFVEQRQRMHALALERNESKGNTDGIRDDNKNKGRTSSNIITPVDAGNSQISLWRKLGKTMIGSVFDVGNHDDNDDRVSSESKRCYHFGRILRYVIRLHFSLYLINGKFDRISNRITETRYFKKKRKSDDSEINKTESRGSTGNIIMPVYTAIGYLILGEVLVSGVSSVSNISVEIAIYARRFLQKLHNSFSKKNPHQLTPSSPLASLPNEASNNNTHNNLRQSLVKEVNRRVPGKEASPLVNENLPFHDNDIQRSPGAICSICMNTRKDPAAIPCGHIFCWNCIVKHTLTKSSSTRECPLCRSPCAPQDICPLYNY